MLGFKQFGQPEETQAMVFADPSHRFQTFIGIGGAITDASAETFHKLPKAKQDEILQAYYDPQKSIGYTLARTISTAAIFPVRVISMWPKATVRWTVSTSNMMSNIRFKPQQRKQVENLNIFASPWSPPTLMKDNNDIAARRSSG